MDFEGLAVDCARSIREHSIGERVSATRLDRQTAPANATANSEKSRPVLPCMKVIGKNTATSTSVVAMTANPTWRVPLSAASSGGSPC